MKEKKIEEKKNPEKFKESIALQNSQIIRNNSIQISDQNYDSGKKLVPQENIDYEKQNQQLQQQQEEQNQPDILQQINNLKGIKQQKSIELLNNQQQKLGESQLDQEKLEIDLDDEVDPITKCCKKLGDLLVCRDKDGKSFLGRFQFGQLTNIAGIQADLNRNKIPTVEDYVNKQDLFHNNALMIACIKEYQQLDNEVEQQDENKEKNTQNQERLETIKQLVKNGADIHVRNPRTNWTPIHWCAHHGDLESLKYLVEITKQIENFEKGDSDDDEEIKKQQLINNTNPYQYQINRLYEFGASYNEFLPDNEGKFPIDLAGKYNHVSVVRFLIERTMKVIKELNSYNKDNQSKKKQSLIKREKYIKSPLYLHRCIFWACYHDMDQSFIQEFCEYSQDENIRIYVEAPLFYYHQMTPIHCLSKLQQNSKNNINTLNYFLKMRLTQGPFYNYLQNKCQKYTEKKHDFHIQFNSVLCLNNNPELKDEEKVYKRVFIQEIKEFSLWEFNYIRNFNKGYNSKEYIDQQDSFGNTALHLACITNFTECADLLIEKNANPDTPNQEGWTPRELAQNIPKIKKIFLNKIKSQQIDHSVKVKKFEKEIKKSKQFNQENEVEQIKGGKEQKKQEKIKELLQYAEKIFVPDFVIKFNTLGNKSAFKSKAEIKEAINTQMNRMNLSMHHFLNEHFDVFLLKGIQEGVYYILVKGSDELLQKLCLHAIINQVTNLKDQQKQKIIEKFYKMHTYGGIDRIKEQWIENGKWYWPQPLNQMEAYLFKAKNTNFTALTYLRQYLGEKISFFFAWKSFLTCTLVFLAFPGLFFQIYIIITGRWDHWFLPFWVFYVTVWNTLIVEYWKRKSAEINYRWGNIQIMGEHENQDEKKIRNDFVGDECISNITGGLTKYQQKRKSIFMFLITSPILLLLMAAVVATILLVEWFKRNYKDKHQAYELMAGGIQGISIVVLNFVYQLVAVKAPRCVIKLQKPNKKKEARQNLNNQKIKNKMDFTRAPNHRQNTLLTNKMEQSLQQKLQSQERLNTQNSNNADQEQQKFPIINNGNSKKHLQQQPLSLNLQQQQQNQQQQLLQDINKKSRTDMGTSKISKNQLINNKNAELESQSIDKQLGVQQIKGCEADSIELNSLREQFDDMMIEPYSDGFVDIGYITLFAAAFPLGPIISLMANCLEIRIKLYQFMYVLQRPSCNDAQGIGEWLNIWEYISFISIFTNFALLYFHDTDLFNQLLGEETTYDEGTKKLWVFLLTITFLIFFRQALRSIIIDKPKWVIEEEKKKHHQQEKSRLQEEQKQKQESSKFTKEIERVEKQYQTQIQQKNRDLRDKKLELRENEEKTKFMEKFLSKEFKDHLNTEKQKAQIKVKSKYFVDEFDRLYYGAIRSTYTSIEREILLKRIEQISQINDQNLFICSNCSKQGAFIYCTKNYCDQIFCLDCFNRTHQIDNHIKNLNDPSLSLPSKMKHTIRILKKQIDYSRFLDHSIYSILNDDDGNNLYPSLPFKNYFSEDLRNKNADIKEYISQYSGQIQGIEQEINSSIWKKFEYFSLPTFQQGAQHKNLKKFWQFFEDEYITENGLNLEQKTVNIDKMLKFKAQYKYTQDLDEDNFDNHDNYNGDEKLNNKQKSTDKTLKRQQKYIRQDSSTFQNLLLEKDFNIEEKLFLNRIAFYTFKKKQNAQYSDFYQTCMTLQDINAGNLIENALNKLYGNNKTIISKKELFQKITQARYDNIDNKNENNSKKQLQEQQKGENQTAEENCSQILAIIDSLVQVQIKQEK
ncbi:Ankyrin repeat-containing domain [Pseudocohnilembus persalinus]|uniref:Ankyrin repeat-containing domain n=1 Tax=Pseudocohnilembus persalinus TaxID=266149 RepID=A0A0V0QX22_PSEPJ|nr:Ankyrin repeat-containing domain [Pseudocohnilembus persalinus]|eukprot:KRX06795.1 Ankyrin repeat-containing domain [Pseudocohnilembus persalinus]